VKKSNLIICNICLDEIKLGKCLIVDISFTYGVSSKYYFLFENINTNKEYEVFFNIINYKEDELSECAMDICFIKNNIGNSEYLALPRKFMNKCLGEVYIE